MSFRVVVMLSGSGTLFQALADHLVSRPDISVVAVGADRDCEGLTRAQRLDIPTFVLPLLRGDDRAAWDQQLTEQVGHYEPDLVVSAGFMKLLGSAFLARFGGRTINTHPALLPAFPGMHGPRDALAHGVKVAGATVFQVDEGVDTGTILAQAACDVLPDDTVESLHERIKVLERRLLVKVIEGLANSAQTAQTSEDPESWNDQTSEE